MFSFASGDNSDSEEDLDFTATTAVVRNNSAGLGNIFGRAAPSHSAANNSRLQYQAPKAPSNKDTMRNVEIVQEERLEVMSNVRSGVKMATAVSAYKYENNGYESLGKLGLAIIGKNESNCYQLLLYRGKQSAVAVANIGPRFNFKVQQDNYANFVDEGGKSWTVCFDSQDVMINFVKQVLLCRAMFSKEELAVCDLVPGEGRVVETGDSLEVQVTSWMVEHQSLGRMIETTRNKDKGMRFKLGGRNYFSDLEDAIVGMKKGGRRFIITPTDSGRQAYDVEITKVKNADQERRVPIVDAATGIVERMAKVGQPIITNRVRTSSGQEMPELEDIPPRSVSAFSTPRSVRRGSQPAHDQRTGTTPIPILRAESPSSVRSGHSSSSRLVSQQHSNMGEFNMMMSETRLQNTEMRMNIQRISDKMDSMLIHQSSHSSQVRQQDNSSDIMGKLDDIIKQNKDLKQLLEGKANEGNTASLALNKDDLIKQQNVKDQTEMLRKLEQTLNEKEEQLELEKRKLEDRIRNLEQKLESEQEEMMPRGQHQQELKKILSSTAKLLMAQFNGPDDTQYDRLHVRNTIGHTFQMIGDKLQERYSSDTRRDPPPVAAVAPVPAEVEEWEAED